MGCPVRVAFEVTVGTVITGLCASLASKSSYFGSPSAMPIRQR